MNQLCVWFVDNRYDSCLGSIVTLRQDCHRLFGHIANTVLHWYLFTILVKYYEVLEKQIVQNLHNSLKLSYSQLSQVLSLSVQ